MPVQEEQHREGDDEQVPVDGGSDEHDGRGGEHHRVPRAGGPCGQPGSIGLGPAEVGATVVLANRVEDRDGGGAADEGA